MQVAQYCLSRPNRSRGHSPHWLCAWKNVSASAAASKIPIRASSLIHAYRGGGRNRSNSGMCFAIAAAIRSLLTERRYLKHLRTSAANSSRHCAEALRELNDAVIEPADFGTYVACRGQACSARPARQGRTSPIVSELAR